MQDAREMHSSLTMPHQVFVFCGHDGERYLSTIEVLDLAHRQAPFRRKFKPNWDILRSEFLAPRQVPIVSQIDSARVVILGGQVDGSVYSSEVILFDTQSYSFRSMK